jgi:hypothetical protein
MVPGKDVQVVLGRLVMNTETVPKAERPTFRSEDAVLVPSEVVDPRFALDPELQTVVLLQSRQSHRNELKPRQLYTRHLSALLEHA